MIRQRRITRDGAAIAFDGARSAAHIGLLFRQQQLDVRDAQQIEVAGNRVLQAGGRGARSRSAACGSKPRIRPCRTPAANASPAPMRSTMPCRGIAGGSCRRPAGCADEPASCCTSTLCRVRSCRRCTAAMEGFEGCDSGLRRVVRRIAGVEAEHEGDSRDRRRRSGRPVRTAAQQLRRFRRARAPERARGNCSRTKSSRRAARAAVIARSAASRCGC